MNHETLCKAPLTLTSPVGRGRIVLRAERGCFPHPSTLRWHAVPSPPGRGSG